MNALAITWILVAMAGAVESSPSELGTASTAQAVAERLFLLARQEMKDGKVASACERFAESHRIDPALGTVLNLGTCRRQQGRLASAWVALREARDWARRVGDDRRRAFAEAALAELEPSVPSLHVVLPSRAQSPLRVELDGVQMSERTFDSPIPVDPGGHVLAVQSKGYRSIVRKFSVRAGDKLHVKLPALQLHNEPSVPKEDPGLSATKWTGLSLGLVGVGALGVGGYFGVLATRNNDIISRSCSDEACVEQVNALHADAKRDALVADVLLGSGIALAGAGAVLWFLSPEAKGDDRTTVHLANDGARVTWSTSW